MLGVIWNDNGFPLNTTTLIPAESVSNRYLNIPTLKFYRIPENIS